jgi:CRISPR-associated protein Cmr2
MTQYMLLFSLGPVQSFIAQARKTRDLWLGSFLLSALMQESMKDIKSNLIFPFDPTIQGKIPDLPNKYIAIFDNLDEAERAAKQSEKNINYFWKNICDDVWDAVLAKPANSSKEVLQQVRDQWNRQTAPANLFETFWVVVEGDSEHYREWLEKTQLAFDGRKNLRAFQQQEEAGEKSTISGLRSALRGPGERRSDVQGFWQKVAAPHSARDIDKDGSERLDAIDTVKRFAFHSAHFEQKFKIPGEEPDSFGFPSTSSIATASYLEQLITASDNPSLSYAIYAWVKEVTKLDEVMLAAIPLLNTHASRYAQGAKILKLDGDCLFSETFSTRRLEKEFGISDKNKREKIAQNAPKAISELLYATNNLTSPLTPPTPYYAMIQMDGDKMGRLINGVENGVEGKDEHREISRALSEFSRRNALALVEGSYLGRLIYAGGDDVFALAPLARDSIQMLPVRENNATSCKTMLDLVDQLQQQYRNIVQQAVVNPARKELVTASTGIAIAHHYTSLSYVRRVSKQAEQLAKNHYGRNALVVTVLRRSGEQTRVGCHWDYPDLVDEHQQPIRPIPLFLSFYDLFKDDVLSPKCVYNLLEEAPTLVGLYPVDQEGQDTEEKQARIKSKRKAQISEIKRILLRQRNDAFKERLSNDDIAHKAACLVDLANAMDKDEHPRDDERCQYEDDDEKHDKKPNRSVELHSSSRRYGLVEVLGWLLVMLFLARKEHE